jgi:mannosyl-oligosaccharide alpha-1,2-mannosidase
MAGSSVRNRKSRSGQPRSDAARQTNHSVSDHWLTRRTLLIAGAITFGASLVFWFSDNKNLSALQWRSAQTTPEEWESRRGQVKDAFVSSWDAYTKYAWGE